MVSILVFTLENQKLTPFFAGKMGQLGNIGTQLALRISVRELRFSPATRPSPGADGADRRGRDGRISGISSSAQVGECAAFPSGCEGRSPDRKQSRQPALVPNRRGRPSHELSFSTG